MAFSAVEGKRRLDAALKMMKEQDLKALMLLGDINNGKDVYGNFRYFSGNKIICNRQVLLLFPKANPVVIAGSLIQMKANERRSFIQDCRYSEDPLGETLRVFREKGVQVGKVGFNREMIPLAWYSILSQTFPNIEWVEVNSEIMAIRDIRSKEEAEVLRKCGQLCDAGYEAGLQIIKPGVTESEIAAAIEYAARKRGAEDHFTLIGSGRFSFGEGHTLYLPYDPPAVSRSIENGDSVVMEITPRYEGYWAQLVRTVNVGERNEDLAAIHKVCVGAIKEGVKVLKPGSTVSAAVKIMDEYITAHGYRMSPPLGHVCGVDLLDCRVSPENTKILTPGVSIIVHPTLYTLDKKVSFFWGETYIITEDGCENLMASSDELLTV